MQTKTSKKNISSKILQLNHLLSNQSTYKNGTVTRHEFRIIVPFLFLIGNRILTNPLCFL